MEESQESCSDQMAHTSVSVHDALQTEHSQEALMKQPLMYQVHGNQSAHKEFKDAETKMLLKPYSSMLEHTLSNSNKLDRIYRKEEPNEETH